MEREWLRRQHDVNTVVDDTMLPKVDGATLLTLATGHKPDSLDFTSQEVTACQKAFKKLHTRIYHAVDAVQRVVVNRVASMVASRVSDVQVFALVADEAVFKMPSGLQTAAEADRILASVSEAVQATLRDQY